MLDARRKTAHARCWVVLALALAATTGVFGADAPPTPQPARRARDQRFYVQQDSDLRGQLDAADQLARKGAWAEALRLYQALLESPTEAVTPSPNHPSIYRSLKETARHRLARALAGAPADALAEYRGSIDPKARPIYELARRQASPTAFTPLLARYLFSSYGGRAYDFCGDYFFDHGNFDAAHAMWSRLLQYRLDPHVPLAAILLKDAAALALGGDLAAAEQRLAQVEKGHGAEPVTLAGATAPAAQQAVRLRRELASIAPQRGEQPPQDEFFTPGGTLWVQPTPFRSGPGSAAGEDGFRRRGFPVPLPHRPRVRGEVVYLQSRKSIRAVALTDGTRRWRVRLASPVTDAIAPQEWQFAPLVAGQTLLATQGSLACALEVANGNALWQTDLAWREGVAPASDAEPHGRPEPSRAAPLTVLSPPALAGSRLLIAATRVRKEAEAYLLAVDRATGELAWRTFLCSRSAAIFGGMGSAPAQPVLRGTTAYVVTHLGAIAAVDALTGEARWLRRYRSRWPERKEQAVMAGQGWANGPPLMAGTTLLAAPRDNEFLYALDSATGELRWRLPRRQHRYLIGLWRGVVIVSGDQVEAIDVGTGRVRWSSGRIEGQPQGRPAQAGAALFVPTRAGIFRVELDAGSITGRSYLLPREEPGNLIVVGPRLLSSSLTRTACMADAGQAQRLSTQPTPSDVRRAVESHFRAGAWEQAVEAYSQAAGAGGRPWQAARALAAAAARRGAAEALAAEKPREAAALLSQAAALATEQRRQVAARVALAQLSEEQRRWQAAVDTWQQLIADTASTEIDLGEGIELDVHTAARRAIFRIIEAQGAQPYEQHEQKARSLFTAAQRSGRPEAFRAVLGSYPNSSVAWPAAAAILTQQLRSPARAEARRSAQRLIGLFAGSASYPAVLARAAALFEAEADYPSAYRLLLRLRRYGSTKLSVDGAARSAERVAVERLKKKEYAALGDAWGEALELPLAEQWRSGVRLDDLGPIVLRPEGTPPPLVSGRFLVAGKGTMFRRAARFNSVECRRAEDGSEVWSLDVGPWTGQAAYFGDLLILVGHSQCAAVRVRDGRAKWRATVDPRNYPDVRLRKNRALFGSPYRSPEANRIIDVAVEGDRVYAATAGGSLYAFHAATGKRLWSARVQKGEGAVPGSLLATRGVIALCSENPAKLYLFDPTGDPAETRVHAFAGPDARMTDLPVFSRDGKVLFAVLGDHRVQALQLDPLQVLWQQDLDTRIERLLPRRPRDRLVILPDRWGPKKDVVALSPETGEILWRIPPPPNGVQEAFVDKGQLYVCAPTGQEEVNVQAFSLLDGQRRWQTRLPRSVEVVRLEPAADTLVVAYQEPPHQVCFACLDRDSGKLLDTQRVFGSFQADFTIRDGTICAATGRGLYGFGRVSREAATVRLIDLLEKGLRGAGPVSRAAALCVRLGKFDDAQRLLVGAMRREERDHVFAALQRELAGVREARAERWQPVIFAERVPRPLVMEGQMTDAWPLHRSIVMTGEGNIAPVQGARSPARDWEGPDDLAATLSVAWDNRNLYLSVNVTDSVHRNYDSASPRWVGDALMVGIDADNDGGYGDNPLGNDHLFTQALMDKPPREDEQGDPEPDGQYAVQRRDDDSGTVYESALPWKYLRGIAPRPGTTFGLDIAVLDDDGGGTRKMLKWTPGLELHALKRLRGRGFAPAFFGKVILVGGPGDDDE